MAINTETFFGRSTSTSTPATTGVTVSGSTRTESDAQPSTNPGNEEKKTILSELIQIDKDVKKIQKLIAKGRVLRKKEQENNKKKDENKKREEKELRLEEKKERNLPNIKPTPFPKMGFLDRIRQFLFYTLLGSAFVKFGKHIPEILKFTKLLVPAFEFFEKLTGNILNGIVDFIGAGYKAQDKIKEIAKTVGGEDLAKKFDEFNKQFNTFANLAIIAGLAATGGGVDFGGGKRERLGVDKQTGRRVSKRSQARFLERYGEKAYVEKFGKRSFKGLTGKTAGRFTGRFAGKALGKIPIIGGLVDFIISTVIFKEKPGRAAAKALGATIGSALGTFVPVPFAGTILGGIVGDLVGGALYDSLVGGDKLKGKAKGGQATRGGKKVGGAVKRTIRKVRSKPPRTAPQKSIPGKDIGGKKQIEKLFPTTTDPRQKNPLGVLENTSRDLKKIPLLGGLMGASVDLVMGQRPEENTFKKIGKGFGYLIQSAIDSETTASISNIQRQIVGLAGGGMIPRTLSTNENVGMKIGERIAKTLQTMVNSKVSNTLQAIRQQLNRQDIYGGGVLGIDGGGGDGGGAEGSVFDGDYKELLDLISSVEGGYDSLNVGGTAGGTVAFGSSTATKKFGRPFSEMTVNEVMELQRQGKIHATGRYQIIQKTLSGLMSGKYGQTRVKGTDKYNAQTQDKLGIALIRHRLKTGADVKNFRKEWVGLRKIDDARLQKAIEKAKGGNIGNLRIPGLPPTGTMSGQEYGASRGNRRHAGQDFDISGNQKFASQIGGVVIYAGNAGGGYGNVVDIYNEKLGVTERIAEAAKILPGIKKGTRIAPKQPVVQGESSTGVIHYEIRRGKAGMSGSFEGTVNPLKFLSSPEYKDYLKQKNDTISLAPQTKKDIASGITQQATYEKQNRIIHSHQEVRIFETVPVQIASGAPTIIDSTQSTPTTAALTIG